MDLIDDKTIEKMSHDLNVHQYVDETLLQFKCRVIYSSIACWIKAIAMDQPVGSKNEGLLGVSRRHIFDRCRIIIETMCKMFPDTEEWFFGGKEHPSILIRNRLINHGDLLNERFDTNVALSAFNTKPLNDELETVYGVILDKNVAYFGISTVRYKKNCIPETDDRDLTLWFSRFLKEVGWSSSLPSIDTWQYFNANAQTLNNYFAWQDEIPKAIDGIVLARMVINKNSYDYYLLKTEEKLNYKLDPFLKKLGFHRRIMYLLRSKVNNSAVVTIKNYNDHIFVHFNTHLPLEENNLLESYAWPVNGIEDKLEWVMDKDIWEYIRPYILALKIKIEEKQNG